MTDLGMQNGGIRATISALTFALSWSTAWVSLGHEPTMEEYWDWWNQSAASAFRELEAWRKCYPGETVSEFVVRSGQLRSMEAAVEAWRQADQPAGSPARRRRAFESLLPALMKVEAPR
jgi:hypothetical protein